jgi:hypothetical protein
MNPRNLAGFNLELLEASSAAVINGARFTPRSIWLKKNRGATTRYARFTPTRSAPSWS